MVWYPLREEPALALHSFFEPIESLGICAAGQYPGCRVPWTLDGFEAIHLSRRSNQRRGLDTMTGRRSSRFPGLSPQPGLIKSISIVRQEINLLCEKDKLPLQIERAHASQMPSPRACPGLTVI